MSGNGKNIKHKIVIVGGGSAGITVAAQLREHYDMSDIAIIEPAEEHYYQPLWTLVGAGVFPKEETMRTEASVMPYGVTWIKDSVTEFAPAENYVLTAEGKKIGYDFLVVAAGIQLDWNRIKGLEGNVGKHGICSNYTYDTAEYTWQNVKNLKSGNAIFTHPSTPIKCGGAPQKIMYLAEDYFQKSEVRDNVEVIFATSGDGVFSVPKYAQALLGVIERKNIKVEYLIDLVEVRPESREAVFRHMETGEERVMPYGMIHVVPHQSAPDFIKKSPIASEEGWVEVDQYTLQHVRYDNVFSLGDCSNLPTSKTGAAIRKQAPVLVENLMAAIRSKPLTSQYDGYTSCPLVTGYGRLILAEFDYEGNPKESFPFDQAQERYSMYMLKKYGLPRFYWHGMLKGRM